MSTWRNIMEEKAYDAIQNLFKLFNDHQINYELTASFINNNWNLIYQIGDNILPKLFFIFNNHEFYGILYIDGNDYSWSVIKNDSLSPFKGYLDPEHTEYIDLVIATLINFINSQKFELINLDSVNQDMEQKIKILKSQKLNTCGYYLN